MVLYVNHMVKNTNGWGSLFLFYLIFHSFKKSVVFFFYLINKKKNEILQVATYTHSSLSKEELLQNHVSVLRIFNTPNNQKEFELSYLHGIPILHKNPYKQKYIAGSIKCSTKLFSLLLT